MLARVVRIVFLAIATAVLVVAGLYAWLSIRPTKTGFVMVARGANLNLPSGSYVLLWKSPRFQFEAERVVVSSADSIRVSVSPSDSEWVVHAHWDSSDVQPDPNRLFRSMGFHDASLEVVNNDVSGGIAVGGRTGSSLDS